MKKILVFLTALALSGCVSATGGYQPEPLYVVQLPPQRYQQCEIRPVWNRLYRRWEEVRRCRMVYR